MKYFSVDGDEVRCVCDNPKRQKRCDLWEEGKDGWCKFNYTPDFDLSDRCYYPGIGRIINLSKEEYETLMRRIG